MKVDGYIITYRNPDSDGVCSSLAYAEYLKSKGKNYIPFFWGNISEETAYILKSAKIRNVYHDIKMEERPIILIDTHHAAQLPDFTSYDRVIEIIDHHPAGDDDLFPNAEICNFSIGAVATVVADRMLKEGIMNERMALLLGAAIISNTVNFSTSSTTKYDREILNELNQYFKIDEEFVTNMFCSKNQVLQHTTKDVINSDLKKFDIKKYKIGISQIELSNSQELLERLDLFESIRECMKENLFDYFALNIIDCVKQKSYVVTADEKSLTLISKVTL